MSDLTKVSGKELIKQSDQLEISKQVPGAIMLPQNRESRKVIESLHDQSRIDEDVAQHIEAVWKDPGIQKTFENRSWFQLYDNCAYFANQIQDIGQEDYRPQYSEHLIEDNIHEHFNWFPLDLVNIVRSYLGSRIPSVQDVIRTRVCTTGIVENNFTIDGHLCKFFDVGGNRSERKKWIHCFENLDGLLFLVPSSEYDLVLGEDETVNRLKETLNLCQDVCNKNCFKDIPIFFLLNKTDQLKEKIQKVPLSVYFHDYGGRNTFDDAIAYIKQQIESRTHHKQNYFHLLTATNANNIRSVMSKILKECTANKQSS